MSMLKVGCSFVGVFARMKALGVQFSLALTGLGMIGWGFIAALSGSMYAQPFSVWRSEPYPVYLVHTEYNRILGGNALLPFFDRLDRLLWLGESRQILVVHLGGSHVQADLWTGQLRRHFQSLTPYLHPPRRFLFPYRVARTNGPAAYRFVATGKWQACKNAHYRKQFCPCGLMGYVLWTKTDGAKLQVRFREPIPPPVRVRVYYLPTDSTLEICLEDSTGMFGIVQDTNWVEFLLWDTIFELTWRIYRVEPDQRIFHLLGMTLYSSIPGIQVENVGVNGASVPAYLSCPYWEEQLRTSCPDLMILSVGVNDALSKSFRGALFQAQYDTLLQRVRQVCPQTVFLFTSANDHYVRRRYPNRNTEEVRKAMLGLVKDSLVAFWDLYRLMGGKGSADLWFRTGYMQRDLIHFTRKGYFLLGDLLFEALMDEYGRYLESAGHLD